MTKIKENLKTNPEEKPQEKRGRGRPRLDRGGATESFYAADASCLKLMRALMAELDMTKGEVVCLALRELAKRKGVKVE